MATRTPPADRRADALSRERIVGAAAELLDQDGEGGLTFRALSARLRTGPGAIYWHVANKSELLLAATDAVLAAATTVEVGGDSPQDEIRAVALGLFDALDDHPWLAAQVSHGPWKSVTLQIFERIGRQIQALGVPVPAQFTSASALLIYILGAAGQNAANARAQPPGTDRATLLASESTTWHNLDPAEHPFLHQVADQLRNHDDRAQFLAGVDLILAGITGRLPSTTAVPTARPQQPGSG